MTNQSRKSAENVIASNHTHDIDIDLFSFGSTDHAHGVLLVISGEKLSEQEAIARLQFVSKDLPILFLSHDISLEQSELEHTAVSVLNKLEELGAKRLSLFSFEKGAPLALLIVANQTGLLRRALFIDPITEGEPSKKQNFIAAIEKFIPMGLPITTLPGRFHLRNIAHRVRCPALFLQTPKASMHVKKEIEFLLHRAPNSRLQTLAAEPISSTGVVTPEILQIVREFMQVPTKRSQKKGSND